MVKRDLAPFLGVPKALMLRLVLWKPWTTGGCCLGSRKGGKIPQPSQRMANRAINSMQEPSVWWVWTSSECGGRSPGLTGSRQSVPEGRTVWGCAVPPRHSPQAWGVGQCGEPTGAEGLAEGLALSRRLHQGHAEGSGPPAAGWLHVWPCLEKRT